MGIKRHTVWLSVADLGFPEGAFTREIIGSERDRDPFGHPAPFTGGRGKRLGLTLCSPDVGPQLRLEYVEQPSGERLLNRYETNTAADGEPRIFVVTHDAAGLSFGRCQRSDR